MRKTRSPARFVDGWSLARQLFVLQVVVVTCVVLAGVVLAYVEAVRRTEDAARGEVVALAQALAASPHVREAVRDENPSATLQEMAEDVRAETRADFVTIMDPTGIRFTHPDPARIGKPFLGHTEQARSGRVFTETYTGTLGPSMRAVVPVLDPERRVSALVSVGITVRVLTNEVRAQVVPLVGVGLAALAFGGLATYWVSARLRRHTGELGAVELRRRVDHHDAILHAVREGLLLVSPSGRVTLCNDGAAVLLSQQPSEVEGCTVDELGLAEDLASALRSGGAVRDEVHLTDDRVLLINVSPVRSGGRDQGSVVTLRDHTELQAMTGELDTVRGFSESLRSQAHESANRLHTVVSLIELDRPEEAVEFATAELELAQRLTDSVVGAIGEPVLAAVLLGRSAQAHERGVTVTLSEDTTVTENVTEQFAARDLVTVLGNLVDNAVDASLDRPESRTPAVLVTVRDDEDGLLIRVADNGSGLDAQAARRAFDRGWSTKSGGRGLGLALVGQAVRRYNGAISVEAGVGGGAVFTARLPGERS